MIRTTRMGAVVLLLGAMLLAVLSPAAASGASRDWVGGGGPWYLNTNWNPVGYPDPADFLTVASGSADSGGGAICVRNGGSITVLNSGVSVTTPQLWIADYGAGTLNIENGAWVSGGGALICGFSGTTGTANVTGNASLLTDSLTIGSGGTGTLNLSGGGQASSTGGTVLGFNAHGTGIISMTGFGTTVSVGNWLTVGYYGAGTLDVSSGANASCQGITLANYPGSMGTVCVDGPGAFFNSTNYLIIGREGYGALIAQNGGTVRAGECYLGYTGLGRSEARVEGLNSLLEVSTLEVGGTDVSAATLDILDHGEVRVGGATTVRAKGVMNLAGGKLVTGSLTGAGRVLFSSGTLQVTGSGLTFGYNQPMGPAVTLNTGDLIDVSATALLDLGASVVVAGGRLKADTVSNYGALDVRAGGTVVAGSGVYNAAALYLDNGTISAPNGITNDYGASLVARGTITGPLTNFGQTCVTGTLSVSGTVTSFGSVVATNLPDTPLLRCGLLDNYGLIDLAARYWTGQQWVTVPGTVTTVMPTAAVTNYAGAVIRGCSSIGGRLTNDGGLIYANLPGTLLIRQLTGNTLGGELRVADGATMSILTAFTNDGEINLEGPNAALAGGAIANSGTLHGQGRVSNPLTNSGSVRADAGILRLTGSLTNAAGALIEVESGATLFATQGLANNQGDIVLRDATFDNNSRTMTNNGSIAGCGTLRTGSLTNSPGRNIGVGGGDLDIIGPVHTDGPVTTQGGCTTTFYGFVNGTGNFPGAGTVVFLAGYSPGDSPAEIQFGGDVALAAAGLLVMELGGTVPGSQYDVLDVDGNLALGGTLDVQLIGGFQPSAGQAFDILDWGTLSGSFGAVSLPALGGGLAWDTRHLYTEGSLEVMPEPATLALVTLGGLALLRRRRFHVPQVDRNP